MTSQGRKRQAIGMATAALCGLAVGAATSEPKQPPFVYADVAQARRAVQLQADFYRKNLLLIHQTYVRDNKPPAATVLREQFLDMTARGWPKAHWLSVNGNPLNPANRPHDEFEKEASRAIRRGEALVERVEAVPRGGKRYRAVASVPFTGPCLKCHWGDKETDYFGGITFSVPVAPSGAAPASRAKN